MDELKTIINFFFEVGSLRFLRRSHIQQLRTTSDTISDHTYRVTMIGWCLAEMEKVDANKVIKMCLLHDLKEARTGDQNWIHKQYIRVDDERVSSEQLRALPLASSALDIIKEYDLRQSREAIIAKDADHLEQLCQIKELELQGHKEVQGWLDYNGKLVVTESAKQLATELKNSNTHDWWVEIALRGKNNK